MDPETLKTFIGPAIVVGFIVIIVLCVIADKNSNKKFIKKIQDQYKIKDQLKMVKITENNEVMIEQKSGTVAGYKVWNIEDIVYMGMNTIPSKANMYQLSFCFLDENKKVMHGNYLTPSKKPVLQYKLSTYDVSSESDLNEIYDFLKKYNPNIGIVKNGKIEE